MNLYPSFYPPHLGVTFLMVSLFKEENSNRYIFVIYADCVLLGVQPEWMAPEVLRNELANEK